MRSFRIFFDITDSSFSFADPLTKIVGELRINLPYNSGLAVIKLLDRKDIVEGVAIHRGLSAIVDTSAETLNMATEWARLQIESFLTVLTVVTNATVGEAQLRRAHEITEDATTTEYIQVEYLYSDLFKRKRVIDNSKFQQLSEKLLKSSNKRILRAIRWYRKGLIENDPLDRFMSYWIGLENLDKTLAQLLGENKEIRFCASCNAPYELPTSKGIRSLFEKFSINGLKDFRMCRNLRVDLQHGSGDLESAITKVYECSELCRLALLRAIYLSLDLKDEVKNCQSPVYNIDHPRIEFRGHYKIAPKDLPTVPILINTQDVKVSDVDGERSFSFTHTIDSNIPADKTIEIYFVSEDGVETNIDANPVEPKG